MNKYLKIIKKILKLDKYYKTKSYLFRYTTFSSYVLILFKIILPSYLFWMVFMIFSLIAFRLFINNLALLNEQRSKIKKFEEFYINYAGFYLKRKREYIKSWFILLLSFIIYIYIFLFSIEITNFKTVNLILLVSIGLLSLIICTLKFMGSLFMTFIITLSNVVLSVLFILFLAVGIVYLNGLYSKKYIVEVLTFILSWGNAISILTLAAFMSLLFQIFIIINRPPNTLETTKSALKIVNIISTIGLAFILLYLNTLCELLYSYCISLNAQEINQTLANLNVSGVNQFTEYIRKIITVILLPFTSGSAIVTLAVDYIDQKYKKKSKKDYLEGFKHFLNEDLNASKLYFKKSVYYGGSTYEVQLRTNPLLLNSIESLMTEDKLNTTLKTIIIWTKKIFDFFLDFFINVYKGIMEVIYHLISETEPIQHHLKIKWASGKKLSVIIDLAIFVVIFMVMMLIGIWLFWSKNYLFLDYQVKLNQKVTNFFEKSISDNIKSIMFSTFLFIIVIGIMIHTLSVLNKYKVWMKFFFLIMRLSVILFIIGLGLIRFSNAYFGDFFLFSSVMFISSLMIFELFKKIK